MQDLNDKVTGGSLTADEWNEVPSEIQNVIESIGQILSGGNLTQLLKAIAGYAANGPYYIDSGIADSYVLSPVGSKSAPHEYAVGERIRFIAGNTNTGASTVNRAGGGVKAIEFFGIAAPPGSIAIGSLVEAEYNGTAFQLVMDGNVKAPSMAALTFEGYNGQVVTLQGFHTPGDGGTGEFFYKSDEPRANHNGGTIRDPTNPADLATWDAAAKTAWFTPGTGVGCWIKMDGGTSVGFGYDPRWFGSDFVDDTASIFATRDAALLASSEVIASAGTYILSGADTLEIDLGKISFTGSGSVTFDCTAMTATNAVQIYSSIPYPARHNTVNKLSGILWLGNQTSGRHGLLVGHATNAYNGQLNIENCAFFEFDRNHHYTDNAWRVTFRVCAFGRGLTYQLFAPAGITNAGEAMSYYHCQLHDNLAKIRIESDSLMFNFYSCSILNTPFEITGIANTVNFFGGNNENPGSGPVAEYKYMLITGRDNLVTYDSTRLSFRRTITYTDSPFEVAHAQSCIIFNNIVWPDGPEFEFETGGSERTWCKGPGSVMLGKNFLTEGSAGFKFPIAKAATAIRNGDFETGDMTGWTVSTFGTGGSTAIASAVAALNGSFGLLVTTIANGGINVTQEVPCPSGVLVYAGANHITTTVGSGTVGFIQLLFKDADGATILTTSNQLGSVSEIWLGSSLTTISPPGTVSVVAQINGSSSVTPHVFHIDDIVLNICS